MDGSPPAQPAPDLFRALELEPIVGAPLPDAAPRMPAAVEDEIEDDTTNPVSVPAPPPEPDEDLPTRRRKPPVAPAAASSSGALADLLEPESGAARAVHDDVPDPIAPAPFAAPEPAAPQLSAGVGPEPLVLDEAPARRGFPVFWILLVLMLGGALAWVVLTQTDLRFGDVIAKRDAEAEQAAEVAVKEAAEQAEASKREYGTIAINSDPDGAQVFMFEPGPAASFENLPRGHEYVLLIEAPGQVPQIRRIKGTEIAGKLVIDLDPAPDPDRPQPIPDTEPPRIDAEPNLEDTTTLEVESPDEGVRFGLLVGYTPGVRLVDLEAAQTHELLVYKPGYAPHQIVVKGRHWEESGEGLIYSETVSLELAEPEPEGDLELGDETGGEAMVGETDGDLVEEPPPAPKPKKKKRNKKKKKKR